MEPNPISGWRVEVSVDRGITWTVAIPDTGASVPTANFNDLSGGTSYRFRVRPVSGSRIGPPIAASSDTSSVEPPRAGATQALPMLAATGSSVAFLWLSVIGFGFGPALLAIGRRPADRS